MLTLLEPELKRLQALAAERKEIRDRQSVILRDLSATIARSREIIENSYKVINSANRQTRRNIHLLDRK